MRVGKNTAFFGILLLATVIINLSIISAESCSVVPEANCATQDILQLSGNTNAHVATITQGGFPTNYVLCCDFGSGTANCDAGATPANRYLRLSHISNAHTEVPNHVSPTYTLDFACYNVESCRSTTGSCGGGEIDMLKLSSETNAQTASISVSYPQRVCCAIPEGGPDASIEVSSPNGGEDWEIDSVQTITWTHEGTISDVTIKISRDDGLTWDPALFTGITNDGTEDWTVTGPATTTALIKIEDASDPNTEGLSAAIFEISESGGGGAPVNCYTDAYWQDEVSGLIITGIGDDDFFEAGTTVEMAVIGDGTCTDPLISVKDNDDDSEVGTDSPMFVGTKATGSWVTEYPLGATGYARFYFTATDGADSTADSRLGTGSDFVRILPTGIIDCPGYITHGETVCNDDLLNIADATCPPGAEPCTCAWDQGTCVLQDAGGGGGGEGTCTWTQDTGGDNCDDGFLSYTMVASWSGEAGERPAYCEDKIKTVECPAQIALPFFTKSVAAIAIIAILGIYFFTGILRKRKK